jgi:hypothetical protein
VKVAPAPGRAFGPGVVSGSVSPPRLLALLALALALPARADDAPAPSGASTTVAAQAPPSAAAILRSAVAIEPTQRIALAPGAEAVVDAAATFEVELSARAADARLVLVDARDDLVAAAGSREVSGTTRLTLVPSAPLVPGSRYALRVDGASTRDLHDDSGRAYGPVSVPILTAGTPPAPEPKKPPERKKRRRQ